MHFAIIIIPFIECNNQILIRPIYIKGRIFTISLVRKALSASISYHGRVENLHKTLFTVIGGVPIKDGIGHIITPFRFTSKLDGSKINYN